MIANDTEGFYLVPYALSHYAALINNEDSVMIIITKFYLKSYING